VPALFAGLMVFNADFVSVPWMASKVEGNKDGSVWTFTIRKDSRWSDNAPLSARDFEWSWKRQLDPASAAPYASFLYDIKNGEAFNKKQITDASQVGVRAKDDWTLEVTLEGPRGYFPVLAAYLAALPAYRSATSGRRRPTSSATGRSPSTRGSTTGRSCSRRTRTTTRRRTSTSPAW
jgi:ABC-type oligopeptide transport system substrate-binding subunit